MLAYTNDGLAVGFVIIKKRSQINIDVWQIYINGVKPKNLKGSCPNRVKISYKYGIPKEPLSTGNFKPQKAKTINGVAYTGRALDLLDQFQYYSTTDVERVLKDGTLEQEIDNSSIYVVQTSSSTEKIVVNSSGQVSYIIP